jgi:hypothetical protein
MIIGDDVVDEVVKVCFNSQLQPFVSEIAESLWK